MICWQQDGMTTFDTSTTHQRHGLLTAGWNYHIWHIYHTSKTWPSDSRKELLHLTCLPCIKDMTFWLQDGIIAFDMFTTHQRHDLLTAGWNYCIWHVYHTSKTWPSDSRMELLHLTCLPHIKDMTFWLHDGIIAFDMFTTHQRHDLLTAGWNYCIWHVYHTSKTWPSDCRMELLHLTCLPHIKDMTFWLQDGIIAFDMFTTHQRHDLLTAGWNYCIWHVYHTSKTWPSDCRMELLHLTCLPHIKDMTFWLQDGIIAFDMFTTHQRHDLLTAGWNYCIWHVYHTSKTWPADCRMESLHLTCLPHIKDMTCWLQDGIIAFDMFTTHQRHDLLTAGWNHCIWHVYHTSKTWPADSRMKLSHLTCVPHMKDITCWLHDRKTTFELFAHIKGVICWLQDGITIFDMFTTHQRRNLLTAWLIDHIWHVYHTSKTWPADCMIDWPHLTCLPHIKDMTFWQQDGITAFARACAINMGDAVIASVQSKGYGILSNLINPGRFLMKINKQLIRLGE